jgi:hypothetical protein
MLAGGDLLDADVRAQAEEREQEPAASMANGRALCHLPGGHRREGPRQVGQVVSFLENIEQVELGSLR